MLVKSSGFSCRWGSQFLVPTRTMTLHGIRNQKVKNSEKFEESEASRVLQVVSSSHFVFTRPEYEDDSHLLIRKLRSNFFYPEGPSLQCVITPLPLFLFSPFNIKYGYTLFTLSSHSTPPTLVKKGKINPWGFHQLGFYRLLCLIKFTCKNILFMVQEQGKERALREEGWMMRGENSVPCFLA
jgi:hypothetical protein